MRSTSCTPSISSISAASGVPRPTAPSTVRVTPVDRWTSIPISTRRATTCSICASLARSSITTTMASVASTPVGILYAVFDVIFFRMRRGPTPGAVARRVHASQRLKAVNHTPLEAARFVDDALEQARDRVGPERPLACDAAHVFDDLLLALGLIDFDAERLLQPPDLARAARALVEQPDEDLVHAIDVVPQVV